MEIPRIDICVGESGTLSFRARRTRDLRNNQEIKEVRLLNGAIMSLRKTLSFDDVMIYIAAMIQTMWHKLFRVGRYDKLKLG